MRQARVAILFATCLGVGYFPKAPGTAGAAVGTLLFHFLVYPLPFVLALLLTVTLFFVGVWASRLADRAWKTTDSGRIVVDEVVGVWVTLLPIYWWTLEVVPLWKCYLVGFLVFRFFDIAKPPPVRYFDRRYWTGYGVMVDDLVAGLYGAMALVIYLNIWA